VDRKTLTPRLFCPAALAHGRHDALVPAAEFGVLQENHLPPSAEGAGLVQGGPTRGVREPTGKRGIPACPAGTVTGGI